MQINQFCSLIPLSLSELAAAVGEAASVLVGKNFSLTRAIKLGFRSLAASISRRVLNPLKDITIPGGRLK